MQGRLSFSALALTLSTASQALTYTQDFMNGIPASKFTTSAYGDGTFSLDDTQGDVRLAKLTSPNGGMTGQRVAFDLANFGGKIVGDFSTSVDLRDVTSTGSGISQFELQTFFADSSFFINSFSNEGASNGYAAHVWDGSFRNPIQADTNAGTLRIARVGSILSGYLDDKLIYATNNAADLTSVSFVCQTFTGNSPVSATYDNFTVSGQSQAVPEPASLSALAVGTLTALRRRNRGR
ncbi:PEP-CTERM sorting domain-containing protein [bacterium]|nr:MAG: PEP-CTERM sorting domain-containing protein [bacterium]